MIYMCGFLLEYMVSLAAYSSSNELHNRFRGVVVMLPLADYT